MTLFHIIVAFFFFLSASVTFFRPSIIRKIMKLVIDKDLFFLPGILEIVLGLGTLYFRHSSKLKWFVYLAGFMLFIDGIFYLVSSKRLKETYKWFIEFKDRDMRIYAVFMLMISVGYLISGI